MAESYKILGAADLPTIDPPPAMITSPMSQMRTAEEIPSESLIYKVPEARQAIIKLIVITSAEDSQYVMVRCYTDAGPVPLFGSIVIDDNEWAEWTGSLTLGENSEIRGAISTAGSVSVAVYGMERSS